MRILLLYANCMLDNLIPVGLTSLLGAMRQAQPDLEIELFDTTLYRTEEIPPDEDRTANLQVAPVDMAAAGVRLKDEDVHQAFRRALQEFRPDMLMVSFVESTFDQARGLLEAVADIRPYTMAGGVYAILAGEDVIAEPLIDAVCVGEGELSVPEFLRLYRAGEDYTAVRGLWFKQDGRIIRNELMPLADLNSIAHLDFSIFPKERFLKPMQGRIFRMVPIEFSRGCPYRCGYCANHALERHFKPVGRWLRWKNLDRIFAEIDEYVNRYAIEFFYFVSESFLSMAPRAFDEFCERYAAYKVPFWFNTRPETITEHKLRQLEEINCFRVGIGLEHGNEEFRKKMLNRTVKNSRIVEACHMVERSRISYSINNIIGFPGETRELVFDTIRLNRQIHPDSVGTFIFTPFKGTDLHRLCVEQGYLQPDAAAGNLNRYSILSNTPLSDEQLRGLMRTFPLYVYFDEALFPEIERAERFDAEGNAAFQRLAERYMQEHFGQDSAAAPKPRKRRGPASAGRTATAGRTAAQRVVAMPAPAPALEQAGS